MENDLSDLTTGELSSLSDLSHGDGTLSTGSLFGNKIIGDSDFVEIYKQNFNSQHKNDSKEGDHSKLLNFTQMEHDLRMCKIELSQREAQLNNLRIEYTTKCEQLNEKCNDLHHQNQMLTTRLHNTISVHKEEDDKKQEQIRMELQRILIRQNQLEEANERYLKSEQEVKKELRTIDVISWTNEDYDLMLRRDEDLLTIKEFAAVT
jgi:progesterone-induced-blocking factor 1